MIIALWNLLVCLVLSLVCWTFLLGKHSETRIAIFANVGLLFLGVGMFVSAFAPFARSEEPAWWALLARTGGAVVAAARYEQRFGVRSQAAALVSHFRDTLDRWRARYARVRDVVRAANTERRR